MADATPRLPEVHLFAFGRAAYAYALANMAASLRHYSPDLIIVGHFGDGLDGKIGDFHRSLLNRIHRLHPEEYTTHGLIDPGKLKCQLGNRFFGPALYLDVDGIVVRDIRIPMRAMVKDGRPYLTEVISKGTKEAQLTYFDWVEKNRFCERLGLKDDAILYALQSSWAYFDKATAMADRVDQVKTIFTEDDLANRWGAFLPDELIYSGACSLLEYDPSFHERLCFYGREFHDSIKSIAEHYTILSLYGQQRKQVRQRYLDMYDRELTNIYVQWGQRHQYKASTIMAEKHVNFTRRDVAANQSRISRGARVHA